MKNEISNRDIELLSAYLDHELNPKEKARLEARLQSDPALRSYLGELHQNRAALRSLPRLRAPRNFTLTPEVAGIKPQKTSYPVFGLVSALSSLLLILVLVGDFVVNPALRPSQLPAEIPAILAVTAESGEDTELFTEKALEDALSTQPIEEPQAASQLESAAETAVEELRMEESPAPTEEIPAGVELFSSEIPEGTLTPSIEGFAGTASPSPTDVQPTDTPTLTPPTVTPTILQAEPSESIALPEQTAVEPEDQTPEIPFIRFVEISLAAITLVSGLAWLYLRTKST